jgi:excisionase family DNA binding protein
MRHELAVLRRKHPRLPEGRESGRRSPYKSRSGATATGPIPHPSSHDQPSPYDRSPNDATRSAVARRPPDIRKCRYPPPRLLVQMLVHRPWTSRPVAGTVGPVMRIDGRAALTLPEAARWLGLTVPCVSALIARGELPSLRDPDGGVRISAAALIEWAGSAARGGPPSAPK